MLVAAAAAGTTPAVTLTPSHNGQSGFVYSTKLCWLLQTKPGLLLGLVQVIAGLIKVYGAELFLGLAMPR